MKLHKSLAMIPLMVSLGGKSASNQKTNFVFNEDDLKMNFISVDQRLLQYSKLDDSFIFDDEYIKIRLRSYVKKWRRETAFLSDVNKIISNSNFVKIVNLGNKAVPSILAEIQQSPSNLVWSLNLICGFNISKTPISMEDACRLWVKWGLKESLIS